MANLLRRRRARLDMPILCGDILTVRHEDQFLGAHVSKMHVDTHEFQFWAATANHFAYDGTSVAYAARKEPRHGNNGYWYAVKRCGNRVVKLYIGRTDALTAERLHQVAREFAERCR